jgi:hypothetical protein
MHRVSRFFSLRNPHWKGFKDGEYKYQTVELSDKGCRNIAAHEAKMLGAMKSPSARLAVDFLLGHYVEVNEVEAFIDKDWDGWTARGR